MKPGNIWRKKVRKFFSDPSVYALLLVLIFGYVIYQGCVFDPSGIRSGTPLGVTPPPDGCSDQYYFYDVNSYFGVYGFSPFPQYQLSSGSLPQGLGLDTSTGIISGTPIVFGIEEFDFQVQAIDAAQAVLATGDFRIRINDFSITTAQLPPVCDGTTYSAAIEICGGVPPFTWETVSWDPGALPLNFVDPSPSNTRQNTLTGIPVNAGDYRFTVRVTDSRGDAFRVDKEFEIEVIDGLTILTPRNLPIGFVGVAYSQVLEACGGTTPYTWNEVDTISDPWPGFLSLDPSSGILSGTPAVAGAYLLKVRLSDQGGSSTEKYFTLTVAASPLMVSPASVNCVECFPCSHDLSTMLSGGLGIPFWQLAAGSILPPNLTLSSEGILSGISTTPGLSHFDVAVFDGTVDPLSPPRNTVTVTVTENPVDSGVIVERAHQWPPDPNVPNYQPPNRINLAEDRTVKFDFRITDANWESTWNAMVPTPMDPVERRQVRLSIVGLCGISITTDIINSGDPDGDGVIEQVATFALSDPLIQDFLELIISGGGVEQSPFTFRVELDIPEVMVPPKLYHRIANIVVVNEP